MPSGWLAASVGNERDAAPTGVQAGTPRSVSRIAEDDPAKAADLFLRALEYHVPKLGRSELTGPGGRPLSALVPVLNFTTSGPAPEIVPAYPGQ